MFLKRISVPEYEQLVQNSVSLANKGGRPGILLTPHHLIIKHTYKRNWWSSSTVWPYPMRFKKNAVRLLAMGFTAPTVKAVFNFPPGQCYLTIYSHLPGITVRELSQQGEVTHLQKLPQFIENLHDRGVYFRDIHTANLLYQPNQQFALLDIASVKIYPTPLNLRQRVRNMIHLIRKQECRDALLPIGLLELINQYLHLTPLSFHQRQRFWNYLRRSAAQKYNLVLS
jgi:serine/threonine protein kinase